MNQPAPRAALDAIPVYRPGAWAPDDAFKLSSNENPYPPLPGVVEAAGEALARMNRYPDAASRGLYAALANRFGLPQSNFAVGPGSVSLLYELLRAVCGNGDHVIVPWRSFEAYPIAVRLSGARPIEVPLTWDGRHDLSAMLDEVTSLTKVILLCSPNNPTGPALADAEVRAFLDAVPPRVLVVLDEAYVEFVRDPAAARGLPLFATYDNLVLLRTFSKAYGLAGLRVGFAIAPAPIAEGIRKVVPPFAVTQVAEAAAIASLEVEDELRERVDAVVTERDRVVQALRASGWEPPVTQANFLWLPLGAQASAFAAAARDAAFAVRAFDGDGVRVAIGLPEVNDRFVEWAEDFRASR